MKISILIHNADSFSFDQLPFLSQMSKQKVTYLFGKPTVVSIESKKKICIVPTNENLSYLVQRQDYTNAADLSPYKPTLNQIYSIYGGFLHWKGSVCGWFI